MAEVNWRKGIARALWVWSVFWLLIGLLGYWLYDLSQKSWLEAYERRNYSEMVSWTAQSDFGNQMIEAAIFCGIVMPVASGIIVLVGRWIYRGFKPSAKG